MRGFVIPKRWLISIALVGLLSLIAASYSARWSGAASADTTAGTGGTTAGTEGTTGGTTAPQIPTSIPTIPPTQTPTPVPSVSVLIDCTNFPTQLTLNAGASVSLGLYLVKTGGIVDNDLPAVTYGWSKTDGSLSSTTSRTATYTAPSSGPVTITVLVSQSSVVKCTITITVNVVVAAPAAVATPKPVNPAGPVPVFAKPKTANTDISVVTPAEGGTVTSTSNPKVQITLFPGSVTGYAGVQVQVFDPLTVALPPPTANTFKFGSLVVDIKITDEFGNPLSNFPLGKPAKICLPYTLGDVQSSYGGANTLAIYHYSTVSNSWVQLITEVDYNLGVICAYTSSFSLFAVGLAPAPAAATATPVPAATPTATPTPALTPTPTPAPQPTATPAPSLPPTGDYAPGSGVLAIVALIGLALVTLGILAMRRARKPGST